MEVIQSILIRFLVTALKMNLKHRFYLDDETTPEDSFQGINSMLHQAEQKVSSLLQLETMIRQNWAECRDCCSQDLVILQKMHRNSKRLFNGPILYPKNNLSLDLLIYTLGTILTEKLIYLNRFTNCSSFDLPSMLQTQRNNNKALKFSDKEAEFLDWLIDAMSPASKLEHFYA